MGVMSCSRSDCNSIMCDTYVDGIGYVCPDCQTEFKEFIESENVQVNTENEIHKELKEFMDRPKAQYDNKKEISVSEFFRMYTK